MHIACKRVALADEQRRGFLLLESGILFNCKDRVKDCLKLPSYDLMRARSPECNTAWILDPASSKHLSSKRDTGVDQNGMSSRNLTNPYTNPHWLGFKLLKAFINHLLLTIHHDNLTEISNTDCWGLEGNEDSFIDLDNWDPRQASQDVYKVIALLVTSGLGTLTSIYPQWTILRGGLWPSPVKSIQLPSREVFEIRGSWAIMKKLDYIYIRKKHDP